MMYQQIFQNWLAPLGWMAKRSGKSLLGLIAAAMLAGSLVGCVASSNPTPNAVDQSLGGGVATASAPSSQNVAFSTSGTGYRIGAYDVLDITVFQVPELTKSVQVGDSGTINLPLVGEVNVAGQTPSEVERALTAKLGAEYLQNPQVSVYVKEHNSQNITVTGAVKKPGVYPIKGKISLMQAVAMAGDFDAGADSNVLIVRQAGGKRMAARFDVSAIQKGQAEDPALQGGDQIVAGSSAIKRSFNAILKAIPLVGTFALL